jgi:hypothetical protein
MPGVGFGIELYFFEVGVGEIVIGLLVNVGGAAETSVLATVVVRPGMGSELAEVRPGGGACYRERLISISCSVMQTSLSAE